MNPNRLQLESPWPHRWSVALVCATFPLIWIGGLVTTYDAGMAVPDWPNTYGYNLFLYPWQTWITGPWGLFIEHGHRLLGSLVGMLTIALLVSCWRCQSSSLLRWMSVVALAAVIFQGALGGMRVIEDKVQLARIHGCFGPAFFALSVALAVMTSRHWKQEAPRRKGSLPGVEHVAVVTTLLAYLQIVLGSQLRHLPAGSTAGDFRTALVFHLFVAVALVAHVGLLCFRVFRGRSDAHGLLRPVGALAALIVAQVSLGAATWVAKYGWPSWLGDFGFAAEYTVSEGTRGQAWTTTAHVACGSLILAVSLLVSLRAGRMARSAASAVRLLAKEALVAEVAR